MISGSGRELSRYRRDGRPPASKEALTGVWIALVITGGPFLLALVPFLFVTLFGLLNPAGAWQVLYLGAFVSYTVILPLATGGLLRVRERKRKTAEEMMAFFSSKIVVLYSISDIPSVAGDPRAAEAFMLYSRAYREIEENVQDPLRARETIERGVSLVDELLEAHRDSSPG